jgi:hypothetical protein
VSQTFLSVFIHRQECPLVSQTFLSVFIHRQECLCYTLLGTSLTVHKGTNNTILKGTESDENVFEPSNQMGKVLKLQ